MGRRVSRRSLKSASFRREPLPVLFAPVAVRAALRKPACLSLRLAIVSRPAVLSAQAGSSPPRVCPLELLDASRSRMNRLALPE